SDAAALSTSSPRTPSRPCRSSPMPASVPPDASSTGPGATLTERHRVDSDPVGAEGRGDGRMRDELEAPDVVRASGEDGPAAVPRAVASWEHLGNLRRVKAPLLFWCIAWPIFAILDVAYVGTGGEGEVRPLLAVRALPVPWFVLATWR